MDDQLHVSDEQFVEILLGSESPYVQAHLRTCSQCAEEAARVTGAVSDFNQQSKLWAERRAATFPGSVAAPRNGLSWAWRPQAWAVAALGLVLSAGAGWSIHRSHESAPISGVARAPAVAQLSPGTLKADNDLLSAIDGELRVDDSTMTSAYRLNAGAQADRTKATKKAISE